MLMIEPPPRACICGTTACAAKKTCLRLTPIIQSNSAGVTSDSTWRWSLAALLTSTAASPSAAADLRHRGAQGVDVEQVARHEQRRRAARAGHLLHQRLAGLGIDVEEGDAGLLGREGAHERGADAAGAAGDQHHAAGKAGIARLGHAISRSVCGSNRQMRRVSSAKGAGSPGVGRMSGEMRASAGSPPSRSSTMVSAPVGSTISTGALTTIGAPVAPENTRLALGDAFRPDPEHHLAADKGRRRVVSLQAKADLVRPPRADHGHRPAVLGLEPRRHRVHRRRAHEAGDEQIGRIAVHRVGVGELLHLALMHHGDARRHRHRLDLVVGDIDDGGADALMQPLDLHPHLDAQLGVEIGERLVEQEQQGIAHQRAAHRHALALAAGQLRRLAAEQRLDLQQARPRSPAPPPARAFGTWRHSMPKVMFWRTVIDG